MIYVFLGLVVGYCLVQSVRFRAATWSERKTTPSLDDVVGAVISGSEHRVEQAFLTAKGRHALHKHRVYDAVGVLAAIALILVWLADSGLLDMVLDRVG